MKHYPYIQDRSKITEEFVCERCEKTFQSGVCLEWRVDWFQGNCEFENVCDGCLKATEKELEESEIIHLEREARRVQKEFDTIEQMKEKLEKKYEVKELTPYQWRINGAIDIYPTNQRWHDLKRNKRGSYNDVYKFLNKMRPYLLTIK